MIATNLSMAFLFARHTQEFSLLKKYGSLAIFIDAPYRDIIENIYTTRMNFYVDEQEIYFTDENKIIKNPGVIYAYDDEYFFNTFDRGEIAPLIAKGLENGTIKKCDEYKFPTVYKAKKTFKHMLPEGCSISVLEYANKSYYVAQNIHFCDYPNGFFRQDNFKKQGFFGGKLGAALPLINSLLAGACALNTLNVLSTKISYSAICITSAAATSAVIMSCIKSPNFRKWCGIAVVVNDSDFELKQR